jgi:predicted transcriptional regulator
MMTPTLLEIATALVKAQIEAGMEFPEGVNETLRQTFATLEILKVQEEGGQAIPLPAVADQPTDWRKSITKSSITCLECGKVVKQLTPRHLLIHGLDSRSYRTKYAIPPSQPLAARETTRRRQEVVQMVKPWEKSPAYVTGQQRRSATVDVAPEAIETPVSSTATRSKGQRKTTAKKQTVRKSRRVG